MEHEKLEWLDEKINSLPKNNGLYKFVCAFLCKKNLSYKEMYLLLFRLNKKRLGEKNAKKAALSELFKVYKYNNDKLPM